MLRTSRHFRHIILLVTILALLAALPGLASAARSRMSFAVEDEAEAAPDVTITITLSEFSIAPASLTVPLGEPVTFVVTNAGGAQHNLTLELESRGIERRLFATNLRPGKTRQATFTLEVPGEWEMYCPVGSHRALGMQGTVVVAQAGTPTPVPSPTATPLPQPTPTAHPPTPPTQPIATSTPPPQLAPATGQPHHTDRWVVALVLALVLAGGSLLATRTARRQARR